MRYDLPTFRKGLAMIQWTFSLRILIIGACLFSSVGVHTAFTQQPGRVDYQYDAAGRLTKVLYADSSFIQYVYDRNGNLLSITSSGMNKAPTAVSASITTNEDTPSAGVTPSVTDPDDGDTHTFTIESQPQHGNASVANNQLFYTPEQDYNGSDSFECRATDSGGLSIVGRATVTVIPVNDRPTDFTRLEPIDNDVLKDRNVSFSWTASSDVDGDTLRYIMQARVAGKDTLIVTRQTAASIDFTTWNLSGSRHTVNWALVCTDGADTTTATNDEGTFILDSISTTGVRLIQNAASFYLEQNTPNPFHATTSIRYRLEERAHVVIDVFSVIGAHVKRLVNSEHASGSYRQVWDGRNERGELASPGLYIYQMKAFSSATAKGSLTRTMLYVR